MRLTPDSHALMPCANGVADVSSIYFLESDEKIIFLILTPNWEKS